MRVGAVRAVVPVGGGTMNNSFKSKSNQKQMFKSRSFDKGIIMKQDPVYNRNILNSALYSNIDLPFLVPGSR